MMRGLHNPDRSPTLSIDEDRKQERASPASFTPFPSTLREGVSFLFFWFSSLLRMNFEDRHRPRTSSDKNKTHALSPLHDLFIEYFAVKACVLEPLALSHMVMESYRQLLHALHFIIRSTK